MAGIYLIPKAGLKVRNPESGLHLPEEGALVTDSSYWRRRLRDGDVRKGAAASEPKAAAVQPEPKPTKGKKE